MKMKKRLLLLTSLFLLTSCGYDEYKIPDDVTFEFKNDEYPLYTDINTEDFIISTNAKITNHMIVNHDKVGIYTYTFTYTYKDRTYKINYEYPLVDNTPPIFINTASTRTVKVGSNINLCDGISYADDYNNEPSCKIIGDYDLNALGEYKLQYEISDDININTKDFTLKVVKSIPSTPTSKHTQTDFSYYINNYKDDNHEIGIDVSKWQGDIDFNKVKNAGCDFVIIRMGVMTEDDEHLGLDTKYLNNLKNAQAAGLKIGLYVYTDITTPDRIKILTSDIIKELNGINLDLPIAYDFESWSKYNQFKTNLYTLNKTFETFAEELNKAGYQGMLYSSKYYLDNIWTNKKYPTWLAHYINKTTYTGDYSIWQLSNTGHINGIYGDVDIDILTK